MNRLEDVVAALWELGRWAREPWRPRDPERYAVERRAARRRVWRDRLVRACGIAALVFVISAIRCHAGDATADTRPDLALTGRSPICDGA